MSGLNEDLLLSESDEPPIDAHEIVQSISSPFVKRTLPIPRKPNDLPAPTKTMSYVSDSSDDEHKPSVKKMAVSENIVKKKCGVLLSISGENSKKIEANSKNGNIEKRNMYISIDKAQLDRYDINFLKGDVRNVRKIVSGMCHSLRFWLAAKFCKSLGSTAGLKKPSIITKAKVCKLLGIDIKQFKGMQKKIKGKSFLDYAGLSPLEYHCLQRRTHARHIKKYALNLSCKTVQHVISVLDSDTD